MRDDKEPGSDARIRASCSAPSGMNGGRAGGASRGKQVRSFAPEARRTRARRIISCKCGSGVPQAPEHERSKFFRGPPRNRSAGSAGSRQGARPSPSDGRLPFSDVLSGPRDAAAGRKRPFRDPASPSSMWSPRRTCALRCPLQSCPAMSTGLCRRMRGLGTHSPMQASRSRS